MTTTMLSDDLVPVLSDRDELFCQISDLHKDIYGIRPRVSVKHMSIEQLRRWYNELMEESVIAERERVLRERILRKLRHAQDVAWKQKKDGYFQRVPFTLGMVAHWC